MSLAAAIGLIVATTLGCLLALRMFVAVVDAVYGPCRGPKVTDEELARIVLGPPRL